LVDQAKLNWLENKSEFGEKFLELVKHKSLPNLDLLQNKLKFDEESFILIDPKQIHFNSFQNKPEFDEELSDLVDQRREAKLN
jgi:hypothetical protein